METHPCGRSRIRSVPRRAERRRATVVRRKQSGQQRISNRSRQRQSSEHGRGRGSSLHVHRLSGREDRLHQCLGRRAGCRARNRLLASNGSSFDGRPPERHGLVPGRQTSLCGQREREHYFGNRSRGGKGCGKDFGDALPQQPGWQHDQCTRAEPGRIPPVCGQRRQQLRGRDRHLKAR